MLRVYFESEKEVLMFCEKLFYLDKNIELHWKHQKEWGILLQIESEIQDSDFIEFIAKLMAEVFIAHRFGTIVKNIIKKNYYFSDCEEIKRIHEITNGILSGNNAVSLLQTERIKRDFPENLLENLFLNNIKNTNTIHYDSIVKFGLKEFRDEMINYIGLAIDEYKREEEHQEFINSLRTYISKKDPGIPVIHILQGSTFSFFLEDGKNLSKVDLQALMQKEPLYLFGLDESELNLSPLIAMAPEKVKIYGDDPAEPKTLTVINVFQEKVEFQSTREFPFYIHKNQ
ncbi:sporulation protein YtxC [Oceanobacillus sp. Castelsardo]|uniref:sporulation protein YtxC n=1 Tax=Oceanobacillus sp. Castelsardo TaxID=1851204 RepID=UPI0008397D2C|nr:sporulation protein YtxC [Oceanobacillus sp. Castelsardo]